MGYYGNANPDLLALLPTDAASVLEIGGGDGAMARAYRVKNPDVRYYGVEIVPDVAAVGQGDFNHLVIGDVENVADVAALDQARGDLQFDVLVIGDVLEHLHDPWAVMKTLRARMAPGGRGFVCIPNVGHWSLILKQMRGDWVYTDQGLLDKTHLRFFTKQTATAMFEQSGWTVTATRPRVFKPEQGQSVVNALSDLAGRAGIPITQVRENLLPLQWVFSLKVSGDT
ncbi:MAG: class I SAM-dependent methyltransferase [Pseudomonadota bacterium]